MRALIDGMPSGGRLLDIGSGAGDHLFYALRRRPDLQGVGLDRSGECVGLCRSYARYSRVGAEFIQSDLDGSPSLPTSDLVICVTVLQYVEDDLRLLGVIKSSLSPSGKLLIYSPIRNDRLMCLFSKLVENSSHEYDVRQGRRRVYSREGLRADIEAAGFAIERVEEAYGTFGKIYFELLETLLHLSRRRGWRFPAVLSLVLTSPLLAALMMADFLLPVRRGNGVLIVAR